MRLYLAAALVLLVLPVHARIVGMVLRMSGTVTAIHSGGTIQSLRPRAVLHEGSRLRLEKGATASLMLFSGRIKRLRGPVALTLSAGTLLVQYHEVLSGLRNVPGTGVTRWTGATRAMQREPRMNLLCPRGRLYDGNVRVKWRGGPASPALVAIYGGGKKEWEGRLSNGARLPGIRLEQRVVYRIRIRGTAGADPKMIQGFFRLLSPAEKKQLSRRLVALGRQGLSKGMLHYMKGVVYSSFQVYNRSGLEYNIAAGLIPEISRPR